MTPEEEILEKIKYVLSFGNDAQAIRLIEQYGHWKQEQVEQCAINGVSNSLKVGMQTFDLCDCPYQINTWIEKYNIQADNIISINQDSKQVVLFYKVFNDC